MVARPYAGEVIIPVWVASWEIECCQPEAVVGQEWAAPFLRLAPPEPWWLAHASAPIPPEVEALGVVELDGAVVRDAASGALATCRSGDLCIVTPSPMTADAGRIRGRLWFESHGGPGVSEDRLECRGVVRRVRGIPLVYELRERTQVPVAQAEPVDLASTTEHGFPEYLIDLETHG